MTYRCECGDSECSSCGEDQGTRGVGDDWRPMVGDFVSIPAWNVRGQVIAVEGTCDGSVRALIEAEPDDPNPRWYVLGHGEFSIA